MSKYVRKNKFNLQEFTIKLKLCIRLLKNEEMKIVCNDLVKYNLTKAKLYDGTKGHSCYQIMTSLFNNFKKYGLSGLLNMQGKNSENKKYDDQIKKQNKISREEKRRQEFDELIEEFDREQLIKILKIQREIFDEILNIPTKDRIEKIKKIKRETKLFTIDQLIKFFCLSRAAYYKYRNDELIGHRNVRADKKIVLENIEYIFYRSKRTFGVKKVWIILMEEYGYKISYKTVQKYMRELGLKTEVRKISKRRVDLKNTKVLIENGLNRDFKPRLNNNVICTDVTYIKLGNEFAYLSAAIDLRNYEIVNWSLGWVNDNDLVMETFKGIDLSEYFMVHSDHGIQYSSKEFRTMLGENNIVQSMSRVGNSLDNRPIEYWFSILKQESIQFEDLHCMELDELRDAISKYVKYYNNNRIQLCLKNMSPVEYLEYLKTGMYPVRMLKSKTFNPICLYVK